MQWIACGIAHPDPTTYAMKHNTHKADNAIHLRIATVAAVIANCAHSTCTFVMFDPLSRRCRPAPPKSLARWPHSTRITLGRKLNRLSSSTAEKHSRLCRLRRRVDSYSARWPWARQRPAFSAEGSAPQLSCMVTWITSG